MRIKHSWLAAAAGPLCNAEGDAAGGGAPAGDKGGSTPTPKDVAEKPTDAGDTSQKDEWRGKFEGQQKVNRDLEAKLNTLRDGLKSALGVDDKKVDPADLVGKLQEQLDRLTHTNLVEQVARRHGITEEEDLALLASAKDSDAMTKLAARLAPKADEGDKSKPGKPGTPKPDLSQGKAGGGAGVRSLADAMDDYRAQLAKKKQTTP
ncbi:MAG: hypothetical protein IPG28_12540 [Betaproteobacteria bacterium]|nr:hypothetical protein [Betaproteobacteria bacterium]